MAASAIAAIQFSGKLRIRWISYFGRGDAGMIQRDHAILSKISLPDPPEVVSSGLARQLWKRGRFVFGFVLPYTSARLQDMFKPLPVGE